MIRLLTLLCAATFLALPTAIAQDVNYIDGMLAERNQTDQEFKDKEKSPLDNKARKKFKHLPYYTVDEAYVVTARWERTEDQVPFQMKTSTDRLPEYVQFGKVHFELDGKQFTLTVYQNIALTQKPGYEDYLFIPFTDLTTGDETYGGGRYLDVRIPDSGELVIDFNKCYNPYCAYADRWSCPIPPSENFLNIAIKAGVKKYGDGH